jgi:hypothetical protein
VLVEGEGVVPFADAPDRSELTHHRYRLMDFHEHSDEITDLIGDPTVVGLIAAIFDDVPVVMQSLFFEYGTEQDIHQDFPCVSPQRLFQLSGCWIALRARRVWPNLKRFDPPADG